MSKTLCSFRKTIQKLNRLNREISCETGIHWLTVHIAISSSTVSNDIVHSSCLKPIALPVWLAASSCCKRYGLTSYGLGMKCIPSNHHSTRRTIGLCTSRYQEATHKQYVAYGEICHFLCSVISEGKVVALYRWGGKWNHLSMTPRLTTDYAQNYCNRTLIVKVIVD